VAVDEETAAWEFDGEGCGRAAFAAAGGGGETDVKGLFAQTGRSYVASEEV
jgi:hypothetical protein